MTRISSFFALAALAFFGGALAQTPSISLSLGLSVYPSDGQSLEQLNSDEGQCYSWAMQSTGYDPKNPAPEQQPAQAQQQDSGGAAAAGALRGAARGALIANATGNDWEELAALGMVSGGRRGAASAQQRNAQAQQQAAAQQQQAAQQQLQLFKNGYTACMEGRNYAVR